MKTFTCRYCGGLGTTLFAGPFCSNPCSVKYERENQCKHCRGAGRSYGGCCSPSCEESYEWAAASAAVRADYERRRTRG